MAHAVCVIGKYIKANLKKAAWATSFRRVGWDFRPARWAKSECADYGYFSSQSFWNRILYFLFHSCGLLYASFIRSYRVCQEAILQRRVFSV
jgi:hypothetical protein